MPGVTILQELAVHDISLAGLLGRSAVIWGTCLYGCVALYQVWEGPTAQKKNRTASAIFIAAAICLALFCSASLMSQYQSTHQEYIIEVDDSASFNEVYGKYEILSGSGSEYRVMERVEN